MISAGILRNLDPVGRIVIPKNMREALKLKDQTSTEPGSIVEISLVGGGYIGTYCRTSNNC